MKVDQNCELITVTIGNKKKQFGNMDIKALSGNYFDPSTLK